MQIEMELYSFFCKGERFWKLQFGCFIHPIVFLEQTGVSIADLHCCHFLYSFRIFRFPLHQKLPFIWVLSVESMSCKGPPRRSPQGATRVVPSSPPLGPSLRPLLLVHRWSSTPVMRRRARTVATGCFSFLPILVEAA